MRADHRPVRVALGGVAALLVMAWLVTITVLAARDAAVVGAATPAELADRATVAVRSGDAEAFADLLADPLTRDADFAQSYLDAVAAKGAAEVTVSLPSTGAEPADRVEIQGQGGTPFTLPLRIENTDDRWFLSLIPL